MALEALVAKANVGAGTDQLAVVDTAQGKAGAVAIVDGDGFLIKPSRLETLIALMARAVKLLDSNAIVDNAQRQRIVVDAGTITTVSAVTAVSSVTTVSNVNAIAAVAGMDREQYINISKQTMAQGIRSRLTFA
jgi:dihydroxyacetone kinase-like predicted kinase